MSAGELALMYGSPRNATIIAKSAMQLYELHRDAFRYVMVGSAQSQLDQTVSHLKKVELLEAMNERDLVRLAEALEPVSFSDGQNIITEGDTTADYFYIIEAGTVVISSEGEEVVRRHAGEYFGELALLKNVPRIATVTAVDNVVLLQLSRQKFQTILGTDTDWAKRYEREAAEQAEVEDTPEPTRELGVKLGMDDFDIGPTLGFGAYGRVQLVTAKQNGKIYAMKILMKRHVRSPEALPPPTSLSSAAVPDSCPLSPSLEDAWTRICLDKSLSGVSSACSLCCVVAWSDPGQEAGAAHEG